MKYTVTVLPAHKTLTAEDGTSLLSLLRAEGYETPAACGGRGTCGKCKVKLLSGEVKGTAPDGDGFILSCRAAIHSDLIIEYHPQADEGLKTEGAPLPDAPLGAALDIGTTTLALRLYDLGTKALLGECTALNPQGAYGADVLSRITAFGTGAGEELQRLILKKTRDMLTSLAPQREIERLTVAANPTMLHLFLGINPTPIGTYPFTPAFQSTQRVAGEALGLCAKEVILLPFPHAYVGGDVMAGVLYCKLHESPSPALLIDVGTNGEMVLSHNGRLLCASSSAGPALEGASIECGVGGVKGAINRVWIEDGRLLFSTVGEAPPIGICGAGLVDLIATLLSEGLIDESGAFDTDCDSFLAARLVADRFYLSDTVYLSAGDIRQFQLAKAAISAGIKTLLHESALSADDVEEVSVAGGLGFYMSPRNAEITGLLPSFPNARVRAVGNTALLGSALCLLSPENISLTERLSERMENVELSFSDFFRDTYIEDMGF